MAARIVLYGATGYTGRLTAEALVAAGAKPVLAGRSAASLDSLSNELGGLETAVADATDPASVKGLLEPGDVIVATVGPFTRFGDPAVEAAIAAGAFYLDSTGESGFIRRVFEHYGPRAEKSGAGLVTAFGYDWVPGNLAAALALEAAAGAATRVDVGYFFTGTSRGTSSGGTNASIANVVLDPSFRWRNGIETERTAARHHRVEIGGRSLPTLSAGGSEHFAVPRIHPELSEVNVWLGWFGPASRGLQAIAAVSAGVGKVPGARRALKNLSGRLISGSTGGPSPELRDATGSEIVATAHGPDGAELSRVELAGVNGYSFTAGILAWGAMAAAAGGAKGSGAMGPVEAFGLEALEAGCAEAGISRRAD